MLDYSVEYYPIQCTEIPQVFNLNQIISCPIRITCSSSTIIDDILASYPDKVSQKGIIDIGISDHHLIFCAGNALKTKTAFHEQISFRSLGNYYAVTYKEALKKVTFSNYKKFININEAYLRNLKNLKSLDQINYKKARYEVKKLIAEKNRNYF